MESTQAGPAAIQRLNSNQSEPLPRVRTSEDTQSIAGRPKRPTTARSGTKYHEATKGPTTGKIERYTDGAEARPPHRAHRTPKEPRKDPRRANIPRSHKSPESVKIQSQAGKAGKRAGDPSGQALPEMKLTATKETTPGPPPERAKGPKKAVKGKGTDKGTPNG